MAKARSTTTARLKWEKVSEDYYISIIDPTDTGRTEFYFTEVEGKPVTLSSAPGEDFFIHTPATNTRKGWKVSHAPTGAGVAWGKTKEAAIAAADAAIRSHGGWTKQRIQNCIAANGLSPRYAFVK